MWCEFKLLFDWSSARSNAPAPNRSNECQQKCSKGKKTGYLKKRSLQDRLVATKRGHGHKDSWKAEILLEWRKIVPSRKAFDNSRWIIMPADITVYFFFKVCLVCMGKMPCFAVGWRLQKNLFWEASLHWSMKKGIFHRHVKLWEISAKCVGIILNLIERLGNPGAVVSQV